MPGTHAKLSASSAHRWIECPESVKLSELYPDTGSSLYADEGTIAHNMAEAWINESDEGQTGAIATATKFYVAHPELNGRALDICTTLEPYVEYVRETFADAKKRDTGAILLTEQRVDFGAYVPGGFGTADVIIIADGTLHIIDLKYGKGVKVDAEDNPQLMLYALGALDEFDMVYDIKEVKTTIYQPRLDHISTETYYPDDLEAWGSYVVEPMAREAIKEEGSDKFNAGAWCRFCPARYDCKTRANHNMRLERYREKTTLNAQETATILESIDDLVAFAEDIKARALERALAGEKIAGWKVVEGRSVRKYSASEYDIVKACEAAGYSEAMLYERKLITITALEKLLGKKQFAEIVGCYAVKPPGKPTLVPESDKRPAITGAGTAADDFADE